MASVLINNLINLTLNCDQLEGMKIIFNKTVTEAYCFTCSCTCFTSNVDRIQSQAMCKPVDKQPEATPVPSV